MLSIKREIKSQREEKYTTRAGETKTRVVYEFFYTKNGRRVSPPKVAVPPVAYNVRISDSPNTDKVLAVWEDDKGREQRLYSKSHQKVAAIEKFARSNGLDMESLQTRLKREMDSKDRKRRDAARILWIISQTGLRIGSSNDTQADVRAYGISTLEGRHVTITPDGGGIVLDFIGKKGVRNRKTVRCPICVKIVREAKSRQWSRELFGVSGSFVLSYLKEISGNDEIKIKDLRTWRANQEAKELIASRKGPAPDEKRFKKWQSSVAQKVAKSLCNTKPVTLNSYIDPNLWDVWRKPEWGKWLPKKLRDDDE